jgi:hypothetical protein
MVWATGLSHESHLARLEGCGSVKISPIARSLGNINAEVGACEVRLRGSDGVFGFARELCDPSGAVVRLWNLDKHWGRQAKNLRVAGASAE